MKYFIALLLSTFILTFNVFGQKFNQSLNKDSLFQAILNDLSEPQKSELQKMYDEGDEQTKEFFLFMFSMPRSSKKDLISNIDSNFDKISLLKTTYSKLVPKDYIVSIEFNPANKIASTQESIDLNIKHINNEERDFKQEWNLEYNSKTLAQMIKPLAWTNETLNTLKELLAGANCISIENGNITTIGFARSGMGKYYFKLFDSDLTSEQIKQYNDGCTYIFYKKNIVLEYGGGAIGSECFPD
ncbi:MAG: hypothetical protein IT258_06885 [Saprospiraceae bacterium]|nr:hypothetical protein [Saprospiraceae bacterium]